MKEQTPLQLKLNHTYSIAELMWLIKDDDLHVNHTSNVNFNIDRNGKRYYFRKLPNNMARLTAIRHK